MYSTSPVRLRTLILLLQLLLAVISCDASDHLEHIKRRQELEAKWGGNYNYGGIATFAHLRHQECLTDKTRKFDIGIVGVPLDDARSWRCGGRFGPQATREASSRQNSFRGFNHRAGVNPYRSWARVTDCGDLLIATSSHDGALQIVDESFRRLSHRQAARNKKVRKPKLISIGGDLSSTRSALRALHDVYREHLTIVGFGASCDMSGYADFLNPDASVSIGCHAAEGQHNTSTMTGPERESTPASHHSRIFCDEIDETGPNGIASLIRDRIGTVLPVYLSINLNIIDAGQAPGVSEPAVGGWTTREMIAVLRGIEGLNLVGAEVTGLAPMYDDAGEQTALFAAQVVYEVLSSMVKQGKKS